jgi:uncharacterized protein (DUF433 family)
MDWREHIHRNPAIMLGKPVFRGTRLTVEHVLREMGLGLSEQELIREYPRLTPDHIRAALAYAAEVLNVESLVAAD